MRFEEALIELRKGKKISHRLFTKGYFLDIHNIVEDKIYGSALLCEQWEVLEEPGKTFPEVFEAFKESKKLLRKKWKIEGDEDYLHICTSRILHVNDLLGTDWEII